MIRRWAGTVVFNFTEDEARGETRCSYSATTRIDRILTRILLGEGRILGWLPDRSNERPFCALEPK